MTQVGYTDINESTVYIPFNGYREVIESDKSKNVLNMLRHEGWTVPEPTVVQQDLVNHKRDYITMLIYKTF